MGDANLAAVFLQRVVVSPHNPATMLRDPGNAAAIPLDMDDPARSVACPSSLEKPCAAECNTLTYKIMAWQQA